MSRTDQRRVVASGSRNLRARWRRDRTLILLTLPTILVFAVFHYLPLVGNVMAFQDYSPYVGTFEQQWNGLDNFQSLFSDPAFWGAVKNTLFLVGLQMLFCFPLPVLLALALHSIRHVWLRSGIQSILYLPHFLSWVIVVTVFNRVLGGAGYVNQLLRQHDLSPITWMSDSTAFPGVFISQILWKDAGWDTIIFLAALAGVSSELYEAAAVDGAGRLRRLWHVTLPAIRPVIVLLLIMRLGDALSVGFEQFILQRDSFGAAATEVMDTYVYYAGLLQGSFGPGAAAGLAKGVVGLLLILVLNKAAHAVGEEGVFNRA